MNAAGFELSVVKSRARKPRHNCCSRESWLGKTSRCYKGQGPTELVSFSSLVEVVDKVESVQTNLFYLTFEAIKMKLFPKCS